MRVSIHSYSLNVNNGILDSISNVFNVLGVKTSHGDSARLDQVDVVFLGEELTLFSIQSGEREHTNLVGNVIPVSGASIINQSLLEGISHFDDSVGDHFHFGQPGLVSLGVGEDSVDNEGTVLGRVGVHGSDDGLQLRRNVDGTLL